MSTTKGCAEICRKENLRFDKDLIRNYNQTVFHHYTGGVGNPPVNKNLRGG
jgi:hypothetical protein